MKRKFKYLLLLMLLLPVSAKALTGGISISCANSDVKVNEEFVCSISGTSSPTGITQLSINVGISGGLEFNDKRSAGSQMAQYILLKDSWQGDTDLSGNINNPNGHFIDAYRTSSTNTGFAIADLYLRVKDDTALGEQTITLSDVSYRYDDDAVGTVKAEVSNASVKINVVSGTSVEENDDEEKDLNEPKLTNLEVLSGGVLSPMFYAENTSYAVRLDSTDTTSFRLSAVGADGCTVSAVNNDTGEAVDLNSDIEFKTPVGSKTMSIKIKVANDTMSIYYVVIVDRPVPSEVGVPVLSSLVVGGYNVPLIGGVYDYEVRLKKDILSSYTVLATLDDGVNYKFADTSILSPNVLNGELELEIIIVPTDSDSGYGSNSYIVTILQQEDTSSGGGSGGSGSSSSGGGDVSSNPRTGGSYIVSITIILILSLIASLYYYRRNLS